ncbi:MAG: hypothetical protein EXS59_01700 [Candidatus Taylorbacteria bacterium]|nr:hypothetical protein [Candidatus Taylorbacteria bacterium]
MSIKHSYMLGSFFEIENDQQGTLNKIRDTSETKRYAPSNNLKDEDIVLRHKKEAYSEIPCRASSDLHEWHNDGATVSTWDSVKLQGR